ncbi:unnamed protein product [Vitrella brassicaformis CCMP3155]|uniref:Uncharacterized protein n=1 Tax=Vitrella brassicaformis (strain CCMP3155) TaxID=1169540 RepID=A0A0G4FDC8_VITBC|nr:unnamed protein product [Vitrella brassicaformis CCMP3155]|eukprot:CEM10920.1 unnamed protein product [Vitrella brassicaformis CCMP3155]
MTSFKDLIDRAKPSLESPTALKLAQLGSLLPHDVWQGVDIGPRNEVDIRRPGIHILYRSGWHCPVCHYSRQGSAEWADRECLSLEGGLWYLHIQ